MRGPRREWMDDPGLDPDEHAAALRGLRRINAVSGVVGTLRRAIRRVGGEDFRGRVVDVACGGGDVAIGLNRRGRRSSTSAGSAWTVDGCDLSERALALSRQAAEAAGVSRAMSFWRWDALSGAPLKPPADRGFDAYDLATCTLFLHHLETDEAVAVLRAMDEGCALGGVVLDLRSGWWPWACTWLGVRLLSRSRVVHHDGPASVEAGWTRRELEDAARAAGLRDFTVSRSFPLRWELVWTSGDVAS
ncbi:MAG: methyltransferase domain-containing protein [Planctomycetota bacterium]